MRNDLAKIKIEIEKVNININLMNILSLCNGIYNLCIYRREEISKTINKLLRAKTNFEVALTLIKGIIEPNENKLIDEINLEYSSHNVLDEYFNNFLSILDVEQKNIQDSIKVNRIMGGVDDNKILIINSFREKIIDYTDTLLVIPLLKSLITFNKYSSVAKGNHDPLNVFEYILFRELFISAKIKGSSTRQKVSLSTASIGSTFHETNITKVGRGSRQGLQARENRDVTPPEINDFDNLFLD